MHFCVAKLSSDCHEQALSESIYPNLSSEAFGPRPRYTLWIVVQACCHQSVKTCTATVSDPYNGFSLVQLPAAGTVQSGSVS